jgi:hypothetical protein
MTDTAEVIATPQPAPRRLLGVTHIHADVDAYMGMWILRTFVFKLRDDDTFSVHFVPSGTELTPEQRADFDDVIHVDTGGGLFDQHGKDLERSSSTKLLVDYYGLWDEPGMKDFVELTVAADNIEIRYPLSLHRILRGLWYNHQKPVEGSENESEIDWAACLEEAFRLIDNAYNQYYYDYQSVKMWEAFKGTSVVKYANGRTMADLGFFPRLREIAYKEGVDVALFFQKKVPLRDMGDVFYPLVQLRKESTLQVDKKNGITLSGLIALLREAEAKKRGVSTEGMGLGQSAPIKELGEWYLHDSDNFLCCGSNSHPLLMGNEYTRLTMDEIAQIVSDYVADMPLKKATRKKDTKKKPAAKKKAAKKKK